MALAPGAQFAGALSVIKLVHEGWLGPVGGVCPFPRL